MGKININKPGLLTLIQDSGRYGYQQYGVPVSGVMDRFSYKIANLLVSNKEDEAVLEVTILGPEIEFLDDSLIAITGGDLSPDINGEPILMWESIYVKKGDILSFKRPKTGCRSYISFYDGINVKKVMGSRSTYVKAKIGGLNGTALKTGDVLNIGNLKKDKMSISYKKVQDKYIPKYNREIEVRVILGPQEDYFTSQGIEKFLNTPYKVTNECDRMGYRLEGEVIKHTNGADIISDGINFGAIQVPSHGNPIIMMADRQTAGGYTKIANVISVDLCKVAQSKPGDTIKFKKVTVQQAQKLLREEKELIEKIKKTYNKKNTEKLAEMILSINGQKHNVKVEKLL